MYGCGAIRAAIELLLSSRAILLILNDLDETEAPFAQAVASFQRSPYLHEINARIRDSVLSISEHCILYSWIFIE